MRYGDHSYSRFVNQPSARTTVGVQPRDVVRELEVVGHGLTHEYRTTDLWVFEGRDGRDYALTGSKVADGHAYLFELAELREGDTPVDPTAWERLGDSVQLVRPGR